MIGFLQNSPSHQSFVAVARPTSELWRTVLGSLLIVVAYVGLSVALLTAVQLLYGPVGVIAVSIGVQTGLSPGYLNLILYSFLAGSFAVFAITRLLHKRSAATLFGPARILRRDFLRSFLAVIALLLLIFPLFLLSDDVERHQPLARILPWLPLALLGLLIQTGTEELIFRGYLQQQLGARFQTPWLWAVVPSTLFGLLHYDVQNYGVYAPMLAVWAGLFGLMAADLTARTGALGAAVGFHMANNVLAMLLIGEKGNLDGMALWRAEVDLSNPLTTLTGFAVQLLLTVACWLAVRVSVRA
ncbi:MAG: type II CAAX endopeptidase family protein [Paracoccaceae bacterium]